MIIFPAIDLINGKCVRLTQGDYTKISHYADDPLEVALQFKKLGATHLHIIDLDGAKSGTTDNFNTILNISKTTGLKIQVGGGIRSYETAFKYLNNGVDRVIFGTSAIENKEVVKRVLKEFGKSRVAVSLDIKNDYVAIRGWKKTTEVTLETILIQLKQFGISTLIITDISKDGMLKGPNFVLINKIQQYGFFTIAAGGISCDNDIQQLANSQIAGVIIGKALYENRVQLENALSIAHLQPLPTKRIIPCLDIKNNQVVKGTHFENLKNMGDPLILSQFYNENGADELSFLDITATNEARKNRVDLVAKIAKQINIPFSIGGGIKKIEDISELLNAGADKVIIGSAAVLDPQLIEKAALQFGSQCIVISIDAKRTQSSWEIYTHSGTQSSQTDAIEFAKLMENLGAGELLVNSIDFDGTRSGYDINLLSAISSCVNIPVIASSGAGKLEHFLEVLQKTDVDAVLAATLFHSQEILIKNLKQYLNDNGIRVRL